MNRRLYYIFPDVGHCKQVVDELLVKRIDIQHIHVLARDDINIEDLPEASLYQKRDIRHSLFVGGFIGAILGVGAGIYVHTYLEMPYGGLMAITVIVGILFGAWAASMIGLMAPNTHLKQFQQEIDDGKLLLMVDVPKERLEEIESSVERMHPEAKFDGEEPTIPPFP